MMTRLCARALEVYVEVEYVRDLIRKTHLVPDGQALAAEAWPWSVKIYTLGRFEIHVDGKPLPPRRKAPYQVLKLLKAIVALGGKEVAISRLIDTLWPDAEGDTGEENFHKSLQRLRRLLRHDDLINVRDRKVSLNQQRCWVDATAFDTLLDGTELPRINRLESTPKPDGTNRPSHCIVDPFLTPMALMNGLIGVVSASGTGLSKRSSKQVNDWKPKVRGSRRFCA